MTAVKFQLFYPKSCVSDLYILHVLSKWQGWKFILASQWINFSLPALLHPYPVPEAFKNFKVLAKTTKKLLTTHQLLKRQQQFFKVYTELVNWQN